MSAKWSAQSDDTPVITDEVLFLQDPAGTPASKKAALSVYDTLLSATAKTLTNKTLTSPVINTGVSGSAIVDEDNMASDSATKVPTQQSVKAYVDNTFAAATSDFTDYIPCTMEVPNDTVSYPDVFTLGDAGAKITGFWLPNSGTSAINFKCVVPEDLHATPASAIQIYMIPRTTVANSTVNLTISRLFVNDTEDSDAAYTAESAVDVNLTSTLDVLTIYSYDLTAEPTAGELFEGLLTRTPGAANDDFTEDLLIVAIVLKIERTTT